MMFLRYFAAATLLLVTGCGGADSSSSSPPTGQATSSGQRQYNGTASVGDFLTITINPTTHTLSYANKTNGDTGIVSYSVNADGTYALADPTGNFVSAYEVPGYALIINAQKTGPGHNTPALITAVVSGPISLATLSAQSYNYMQFRTSAGGIEVGSVTIDSAGNITGSSYWPFGALFSNGSAFLTLNNPVTNLTADPSGTFLKGGTTDSTDYIFGTANGQFIVDTSNGAILGLAKATSKAFDPANAGTYTAMAYTKNGAQTGTGNVESGTPSIGTGQIILDASGNVTLKDAQGNVIVTALLTPVADAAYLNGPGKLVNPGNGLFTFRSISGGKQHDIFVAFQGRALIFAEFASAIPASGTNTYDYLYGVALH